MQAVLARMPDRKPLERIAVKDRGRVSLIDVDHVSYGEAAGNYVRVRTADRTHLVRFVRIHRSMIVKLSRVKELTPTPSGDHTVVLGDGTRLTLSRSFRSAFEERVGWQI
jgi:two-component system LytT family response regulator